MEEEEEPKRRRRMRRRMSCKVGSKENCAKEDVDEGNGE